MKNHLTQNRTILFVFSFFLVTCFVLTSGFTSIKKSGAPLNGRALHRFESQNRADVTVLITKPGNFNWTFVLEDSQGNVININNNVQETATLKGLKVGVYTIWELNPYGCGRVYSFQVSATTSKVQQVCLYDEKVQFDTIIQTTSFADANKTTN